MNVFLGEPSDTVISYVDKRYYKHTVDAMNNDVSACYKVCEEKSAEIPAEKTSSNLPATIQSIKVGYTGGDIDVPVTGNITGTDSSGYSVQGNIKGGVHGDIEGNIKGNVHGDIDGNVDGYVQGNIIKGVQGNIEGNVDGYVYGNIIKGVEGNIKGNVYGDIEGNVDGYVYGNIIKGVQGFIDGDVTGLDQKGNSIIGDVFGGINGSIGGDVGSNVKGYVGGYIGGNVAGYIMGNISEFVKGNVGGDIEGTVNGNIGSINGYIIGCYDEKGTYTKTYHYTPMIGDHQSGTTVFTIDGITYKGYCFGNPV